MYDQDTFFHLSMIARTGLALLSLGLAMLMIWLTIRMFKKNLLENASLDITLRLVFSVTLFWLFLWLSPQVYYLYYQVVIDDLPWQNVISTPTSLNDLIAVLFLQNPPSFSHHSKAALGWLIILIPLIKTMRSRST